MRILVLGAEGYLGWPTVMYLVNKGHTVGLVDNSIKRRWEKEVGVKPLVELPALSMRSALLKTSKHEHVLYPGVDVTDATAIGDVLKDFKPDAIIHYAEQPSAPFSMSSLERAVKTQENNVLGTLTLLWHIKQHCPDAHLVKLGTMGEYGTPNIDIEEGYLKVEHRGRQEEFLYPKNPGSFYHLSKVHDSHNMYFACKMWGLKVTDLNQGIVYGTETDEMVGVDDAHTSFHYDAIFGTVLNRFCTQVIAKHPMTVYGGGNQQRAFLNIKDTLRCVELACLNPAEPGKMRIYNQFTEVFSVNSLVETISQAASKLGFRCSVTNVPNPRIEADKHYFNPKADKLIKLGLKPRLLKEELVSSMLKYIDAHKDSIDGKVLMPTVKWGK